VFRGIPGLIVALEEFGGRGGFSWSASAVFSHLFVQVIRWETARPVEQKNQSSVHTRFLGQLLWYRTAMRHSTLSAYRC